MKNQNSDYFNSPGSDFIWLSICSRHRETDAECHNCMAGFWHYNPHMEQMSQLFKSDYKEWYRQRNKGENPSEETLIEMKKMFPEINISK